MAKTLEAGKLIVGAIAISVDPSGTAAALLGIDTATQIKNWFGNKPDLQKLTKELDAAFTAKLNDKRFDKPDEARVLLPQMLQAATLNAQGIASNGLDADKILTAMQNAAIARHKDYDDRPLLSAFSDLVLPLLRRACDDPRLEAAIRPALTREQMRRQDTTIDKLDQLLAQNKGLMGLLEKLAAGSAIDLADILTLEELQELGDRFGIPASDNKDVILNNLRYQAEQIAQMEREIAALRGQNPELDNILGAIEDALDKGRIAEARALFPQVRSLQQTAQLLLLLSEDAKISELEARAALIEQDVSTAFQIMCDTADTFKRTDLLEYAERRNTYRSQLYNHGLRYGGTGLSLAAEMIRPAITALAGTAQRETWAAYTQNLALALEAQGSRAGGSAGNDLLAQAVSAYRDALTVYTPDAHPVHWAGTQQNLAIALEAQGERTDGAAGLDLLAQAVSAYRDALTVRTRDAHPVDWAMTQQNLAGALATQGSRTDASAGLDLLAQAVSAYRDALTVYTPDAHPVDWAVTQVNLALAERGFAVHGATDDPAPHWAAALAYVDAALTVYDPDHMPYDHTKASGLRDDILNQR